MFWNKKSSSVKTIKSNLIIYVDKRKYPNYSFAWSVKVASDSEKAKPWKDFIKWYHSRLESETFSIFYRNGFQSFNRSEILSYNILSTTEETT